MGTLLAEVADAVARRRKSGLVESGVQGLVTTSSNVDRILSEIGEFTDAGHNARRVTASAWIDHEDWGALDVLAGRFSLTTAEEAIFLIALAPDLTAGLERVYGYLNDDVTQRRASIGLVCDLLGIAPTDPVVRHTFSPAGRLVHDGLVTIGNLDRPFLDRSLTVADAVADVVLGGDTHDPTVAALVTPLIATPIDGYEQVARAIDAGIMWSWIVERPGAAGTSMAAAAFASLGITAIGLDLHRLRDGLGLADIIVAACRDAALRGSGLIVSGVDAQRDRHALTEYEDPPCPVALVASADWISGWSAITPFIAHAPTADLEVRATVWAQLLEAIGADSDQQRLETLVAGYRLSPEQIVAAAAAAAAGASGAGTAITLDDLRAGARAQTAGRLGQLARHVEPQVRLDQVILPPRSAEQLREVVDRAIHRELVHSVWRVGRPGGGRAAGVKCLLTGPPGTGKTLSAEAVAHELGVDLYVVDLSQIVDKFIGETEKNLERVFVGAAGINAVLFFDEADALFGKRGDVKGAQDRYANVEVSYLLQRMEQFDGVAMLATNMLANFDDAFMRRLDVIVRFEVPDAPLREQLWRTHLPPQLPLADDVDLGLLSTALNIPGASIANICLSAAFEAATKNTPVNMAGLVTAAAKSIRKEGRLLKPEIFGRWAEFASAADDS